MLAAGLVGVESDGGTDDAGCTDVALVGADDESESAPGTEAGASAETVGCNWWVSAGAGTEAGARAGGNWWVSARAGTESGAGAGSVVGNWSVNASASLGGIPGGGGTAGGGGGVTGCHRGGPGGALAACRAPATALTGGIGGGIGRPSSHEAWKLSGTHRVHVFHRLSFHRP